MDTLGIKWRSDRVDTPAALEGFSLVLLSYFLQNMILLTCTMGGWRSVSEVWTWKSLLWWPSPHGNLLTVKIFHSYANAVDVKWALWGPVNGWHSCGQDVGQMCIPYTDLRHHSNDRRAMTMFQTAGHDDSPTLGPYGCGRGFSVECLYTYPSQWPCGFQGQKDFCTCCGDKRALLADAWHLCL